MKIEQCKISIRDSIIDHRMKNSLYPANENERLAFLVLTCCNLDDLEAGLVWIEEKEVTRYRNADDKHALVACHKRQNGG